MKSFHKEVKVYSPGCQAVDWGFDYSQIVDLPTALAQPTKIAVLPVYYDTQGNFAYNSEIAGLRLEQFNLVLFTDIEYNRQSDLIDWINTTNAPNWLLSVGGLYPNEILDPRTVYRPWWLFTFLQWNPPRDDFPLERPFLWESLQGVRREHRDFVMLAMQQSGLLDRSIVTYRDIFAPAITEVTGHVQAQFPDTKLAWPYVSPNLNPAWEVREKLDKSISSVVPWEIWNRCYFSILVETLGVGDCFLAAEKIGKALLARRLFVHFGNANWLLNLRNLGFETFSSVMDESHDSNLLDIPRWQGAFNQVLALSKENPQHILQKVRPILDHNHNRLFALRQEKFDVMQAMIEPYLK